MKLRLGFENLKERLLLGFEVSQHLGGAHIIDHLIEISNNRNVDGLVVLGLLVGQHVEGEAVEKVRGILSPETGGVVDAC